MPFQRQRKVHSRVLHTVSAGGVVFRRRGGETHILLTRHAKLPKWQLPKGHVERGEALEHAALREVREETGLRRGRIVRKLAVVRRPWVNRRGEKKTIHYFLVEALEPIHERPADPKHLAVQWFPLDRASRELLLAEQKGLLKRLRTVFR